MAVALVLVLGTAAAAPAQAQVAPKPRRKVVCSPIDGICRSMVATSGSSGSSSSGGAGSTGDSSSGTGTEQAGTGSKASDTAEPAVADFCTTSVADPQPGASDPVWQGHDDGVIMMSVCRHIGEGSLVSYYWARTEEDTPPQAPTVTPEQLAHKALAAVRIPSPEVLRSPPASARYQGRPYTWITLPTYFWVGDGSWQSLSRTARLGAVWARVSVVPRTLVIDGGDGGEEVRCDGPGVAYEASADAVAGAARSRTGPALTPIGRSLMR